MSKIWFESIQSLQLCTCLESAFSCGLFINSCHWWLPPSSLLGHNNSKLYSSHPLDNQPWMTWHSLSVPMKKFAIILFVLQRYLWPSDWNWSSFYAIKWFPFHTLACTNLPEKRHLSSHEHWIMASAFGVFSGSRHAGNTSLNTGWPCLRCR